MKKALETTVREFIKSVLRESSSESTDLEGAGEFLPSQDETGSADDTADGAADMSERVSVGPMAAVKPRNPRTVKAGESGEAYEYGKGEPRKKGESGVKPGETDDDDNDNEHEHHNRHVNHDHEPDGNSDVDSGKSAVLKKIPLSGMRYRTIVTDKAGGGYDCVFTSLYTESSCEFEIRLCGESADKFPLDIISASVNGTACTVREGKIVGMKIEEGKTYKVSYSVDSREMFASEVILYAYR